MIISSKKYACETCIKGHRSSACKHTDRPLFEIKKKGRPVTQCEHCRELRKTKQVHVKCICEAKAESSSKQGNKSGFESAAFPNGLPESLGASVAFQIHGEGASSDSDRGIHGGHHCRQGDACTCATDRNKYRRRAPSDVYDVTNPHISPPTHLPHQASRSSSQILARIAELRPVLPRPSNDDVNTGRVHDPSGGPHSPVYRHERVYSPYERGMSYQPTPFPPSYLAPTGNPSSSFSYDQQGLGNLPPLGSTNDMWPPNTSGGPALSGNMTDNYLSVCGCGDDCSCPGCIQHSRLSNTPTSSAYASCTNPAHCGTCLDCTILSLPASAIPPNTALSISNSQPDSVDEWLRQISSTMPSDGNFDSQFTSGFSLNIPDPTQSNWNKDPMFPDNSMNNFAFDFLPTFSGHPVTFDAHFTGRFSESRSRSPSASSQSSIQSSHEAHGSSSIPPYHPNGRMQGIFANDTSCVKPRHRGTPDARVGRSDNRAFDKYDSSLTGLRII
ncbi:hypothetical protein CVT24_005430 [Panaeolus cyanescens]|uniref:Copper-fist domain-containing protein n=1 Tax=Panaeolus cyanescens TaxID=181874 RepID=A0A409VQQ9_9AGAR|nr:hypothetical protein CVT24_005430 [Panaeolus cyanescens]